MTLTHFPRQDLKLKYYDLMIQHALKHSSYLDAAKYYHKVWETPSIKEDVNDKGKAVCFGIDLAVRNSYSSLGTRAYRVLCYTSASRQ